MVAIGGTGTTQQAQQTEPLSAIVSLAQRDESVAKVLRIYHASQHPWKDLYPIYKIIKYDLGDQFDDLSRTWVSGHQLTRFKRTANHPEAAGDGARHGVNAEEPPGNPMTASEGREFIETLMNRWLEWKLSGG